MVEYRNEEMLKMNAFIEWLMIILGIACPLLCIQCERLVSNAFQSGVSTISVHTS